LCVRIARSPIPAVLLLALVVAPCISGQMFQFTREQMLQYTAQNPFDRFSDGRPKVPDDLLAKLKDMSAEEVLGLSQRGYRNQWEAGWQILHPQKRLIGRALTLQMMPTRPDVSEIDATARRAKNLPRLNHQSAIDMLQTGDVLVVDACGAQFGGVIGDNLAYYINEDDGCGVGDRWSCPGYRRAHAVYRSGRLLPCCGTARHPRRMGQEEVRRGQVRFVGH
jgi:4-hydroxy-4-methyl-2-oxoglutarate aldolase